MPTFRNTLFHLPMQVDGIWNRVFRNVGIQTPDAGELPKRKHTTYRTRRKLEIKNSYILFIFINGGILVLFTYKTRLASNEIFTPSNKLHRETGQAKDLSAPL